MKGIVQLRQKSDDQLNNRLNEIAISLRRMRASMHGTGQVPKEAGRNSMYVLKLRKEKARILTIMTERRNESESEK